MNWCLIVNVYIAIKFHDDVIKWKHFPRYWPFVRWIHRSPVIFPHKGQCRGALMFYLICVWIYGWVNNREAGDLRRYRPHYDVTDKRFLFLFSHSIDTRYVCYCECMPNNNYPFWFMRSNSGSVEIINSSTVIRVPSEYKDRVPRYRIPIKKVTRSWNRLIFIMGTPLLVRRHHYIETGPTVSFVHPDSY